MMQFINTFRGFRTSCACELIQTLFSATTKKNRKKRSDQQDYAHAYLCGMVSTLDVMHQRYKTMPHRAARFVYSNFDLIQESNK